MPTFSSNPLGRAGWVALAVAVLAPPAGADTLPRARITVDASNPAAVTLRESFDYSAQGGSPRSEIAFFLASSLKVASAKSQGADLALRSEAVPGAAMTKWIVKPPAPVAAGATLSIDLVATVKAASPGIQTGAKGGFLLPGSGWFPAVSPETDEMPTSATDFKLPAGWLGVACGAQTTPGAPWGGTKPGRPYAAWGPYHADKASQGGVDFVAYRKAGATGAVPRLANIAKIVAGLTTALEDAPGTGAWKLVDVGGGLTDGGQRTLFWDESAAAAPTKEAVASIDRDVASGLATAYWAESMRFFGPQAAFLSGGLARGIGDAAVVTLDTSDERWRTERRLFSERRATFLKTRVKDHALKGLVWQSPEARVTLDGRGALVSHMAEDACTDPASWVTFLHDFRKRHDGARVEWADFARELDKDFPNQHKFLTPYLETTSLPDFVFGAHGPSKKGALGDRYSVEVINKGQVPGYAEVATYSVKDNLLRTSRYLVEPGKKIAVLYGDARVIAHIRLDPRGTQLQSSVEGETIDLAAPKDNVADFIPSFPFSVGEGVIRKVSGLDLQLDGVTITGFSGAIQWWQTYHGPSGAVLLGRGHVVISPTGDAAASFKKLTGKERLEFDGQDFFLRFPIAAWKQISGKVGDPVDSKDMVDLSARRTFMYEHSFPTYFAEKDMAEVPPPGSALVVFGLAGGESRGFVREPLPSGKVLMRLWDHLRGTVIWEATL